MNSLLCFGIMGLSGMASAFIYDIFRASRRATQRVCTTPKRFKRFLSISKPIQDVLSVIAAFLLFLLTAYVCNSGILRSYVILGFICGIVLYAGLFTKITGTLAYGIFCAVLYILRLLLWRFPKRILRLFRKHPS